MHRALEKFCTALNYIAAGWLMLIALVIFVEVTSRGVFNTFLGGDEIVTNSVPAIVFLQIPLAILTGSMLRTTITFDHLNKRWRHIVNAVAYLLGMILFIGSWSMAFGSLFLSFVVLRHKQTVWPPEGIVLPSFPMAAVATLVLLASSSLLHRAVRRAEAGEPGLAKHWAGGIALAVAFAWLQGWLWTDLLAAGRGPSSGIYESLFFGLTWVHAAHVAVGLLWLLWVQVGIGSGRYGSHRISNVSNAALFWHFVDAVWIVLFFAFFVF